MSIKDHQIARDDAAKAAVWIMNEELRKAGYESTKVISYRNMTISLTVQDLIKLIDDMKQPSLMRARVSRLSRYVEKVRHHDSKISDIRWFNGTKRAKEK